MKNRNTVLVVLVLLCFVLVSAVVYTVWGSRTDSTAETSENAEELQERYITYNGKKYKINTDIRTVLFMGIDKDLPATVEGEMGTAGQADSLNLLILDTKEKTGKVLQISRDSMTDIDVYDESGEKVMTADGQICLQYAFGDGEKRSCRLTSEKVSELLGGIDIDQYISLTLDGFQVAADAVGGIPITIPEDYTEIDPAFSQGAELVLNGEMAEKYVRSRDTDVLDSNNDRMNRQSQFIKALADRLSDMDITAGQAADMYGQLAPYMATNMTADDFYKLASYTVSNEIEQIPGEVIEKDGHAQYIVDAEGIRKLMVKEFYINY